MTDKAKRKAMGTGDLQANIDALLDELDAAQKTNETQAAEIVRLKRQLGKAGTTIGYSTIEGI